MSFERNVIPDIKQDEFISSLSNSTMLQILSVFVLEGDREVAKDLTAIKSSNHTLVREVIYVPVSCVI